MSNDKGAVPAGSLVNFLFGSYNSSGASVALSGFVVGDIKVYKNGSTTERASTAGYTATTDFDGLTGINRIQLDLADNTDAGFYAAGSSYDVVVSAVTIDAQTVNLVAGSFRIVEAETVAGRPMAQVGGFTSGALTAINGEVVDVMSVDSFAEPTGVPAAANTLAGKLGTLYMMACNSLVVTSAEMIFRDSAGASEFKKTLTDDGTTYTETRVIAP